MKQTAILTLLLLVLPMSFTSWNNHGDDPVTEKDCNETLNAYLSSLYYNLQDSDLLPCYDAFSKAVTGYFNLKASGKIKNELLTVIDFSISSNRKRLWIINIPEMRIIHTSLVSHGRNSGDEYARYFSNTPSSYKSSLGFYLTGDIYYGQHGKSLYLDGIERGINDNARVRTIVMHSANYVSHEFIKKYGRLGRSFGCPSIPVEGHERIIRLLSGRSCMYIHFPDNEYFSKSNLFEPATALREMSSFVEKYYVSLTGQTFLYRILSSYK